MDNWQTVLEARSGSYSLIQYTSSLSAVMLNIFANIVFSFTGPVVNGFHRVTQPYESYKADGAN